MRRHRWAVFSAIVVLTATGARAAAQQAGGMMSMGRDSAMMVHMQAIHAFLDFQRREHRVLP